MNPWADSYVADMLDRTAYQWPERPAVVEGSTVLTFSELIDRRNALAGALAQRGIGQGSVVATYLAEGWEHIVLIYALLYLGARMVPLNLTWEASELRHALLHADVEHVVAGTTYRGQPLWGRLGSLGIGGEVNAPELPRLKTVIGFERNGKRSGTWWLSSMLEEDSGCPPRGTLQSAYLIYTSGSTATPKAATIRQDAALGTSFYVGERLGLESNDRLLNVLPLYHCGGLISALLGCHQRGAAFYVFEGVDVEKMADVLDRDQCTVMLGFDMVNLRIIQTLQKRGRPIPVRKMQITSGASYSQLVPLGVHASLCYALTESSNFVSMSEPSEAEYERQSNGFPFPGVDLRICDRETGRPLPPNQPGEICFRGWNQMAGYYRDAERTRAAVDSNGFLHTGDYGWTDEDGRLYYRGRYAMMIKTGGENVSEVEVEGFLTSEVPGVVNAAVVGVPDEAWGEMVVAFVETSDTFDGQAIRDACRGKLAKYKIPKRIFEVDPGAWPLTPTGKLKKDVLRTQAFEIVGNT